MSHLDCSNEVLIGPPKWIISTLKRVKMLAAKFVLGRKAHEHSTRCLKQLHWLPSILELKIRFWLWYSRHSKAKLLST